MMSLDNSSAIENPHPKWVKEVLEEIIGDPDADLELRPEFEEQLRQAVACVASGGRLLSMEELAGRLEDTSHG